MAQFGRRPVVPLTPLTEGPAPATPTERVAAVRAALLDDGVGGAAAQGRPFVAGGGFGTVVAVVEHYLPDAGERRALCRQLAEDLQSMIVVQAVDADEVADVLGATAEHLAEHAVPRDAWAACRALTEDAIGLAREVRLGEGERLRRWAADDAFVLAVLAVLLVVFTRLSV